MANKTIINSPPPSPSKRIIGGSNQRSKVRFGLQNSNEWRYNHAPLDGDQSKNATWWKEQAERYDTELSASGEILYGRQAIKRSLNREVERGRIYNLDTNLEKTLKGGSNQPFNKKHRLTNISFDDFEQEINITDELYPNIKKRLTVKATIDGKTYVGEQVLPFSAFSSSVNTGYQSFLSSSGYTNVDFANLHNDKIQPYGGEIPLQGPFTERYVGGIQARHNAPLRTSERKEEFSISLDGGFAVATITISIGGGPFATSNYNGKNVTLSLGGVNFETDIDNTADMDESTDSTTGVQDAASVTDVASSLVTSINASATDQNLPVSAYNLGAVIVITTTIPGPSVNGTEFAGSLIASAFGSTSAFTGGKPPTAGITAISGPNPRGQYLRGQAAKAPVNIKNIKTLFTSDSVRVVGNFTRNYEVIQGSDRLATNMDLAFNPENYAFSIPTAFVTPPSRRTLGLTGSADYPAPRQIASRRTNQTIIVNRFSAPGGKLVSKQQFRDVASDQLSSNNALPFRNLDVRLPFNKELSVHNAFGGLVPGTDTPSIYKTNRNQTQKVQASGSTFVTGTVFDDYFVTRPIPAGDSTQWFFAVSGSDTTTYSEYVLNGNRYPESISITRTDLPLPIAAVAASGAVVASASSPADWDLQDIQITDTQGNTVEFIFADAKSAGSVNVSSPTEITLGIGGGSPFSASHQYADVLRDGVITANINGFLNVETVGIYTGPTTVVQLTQSVGGVAGNTVITGSAIAGGEATRVAFAGGADAIGANFGSGAFTGSDGQIHYIWTDYGTPYSAPWAQLGAQYKNSARNLKLNNLYELLPKKVETKDQISNVASTKTRTSTDQAGNTITNFYSQQFVEPPLTSRYKPLIHQIETFIGSPSETSNNKITLNVEYSYGNSLMGFANRELNKEIAGNVKFAHNQVKRPYEALREQLNNDTSRSLNGVNTIKMFAYDETIYPKEVYTYLSGTRARLSFTSSYWQNDSLTSSLGAVYTSYIGLFFSNEIITEENRQVPRLLTPFTTSQGYVVQRRDQLPFNPSNPSFPSGSGPGAGSIWPLDSFLYSDDAKAYATSSLNTGSFSASVLLADASTTECGELMMTNYGSVMDYMTEPDPTYLTSTLSTYFEAPTVSSQYVYSVAFVTGNLAHAGQPNFGSASVEPRIPGGPFSRPPWTAGSERRFVDGNSKGQLAPQAYPFFNSYDQWAAELRLKGKAHTIIPEYRISEHVSEFKNNGGLFTAISSSLEITGANDNNFDGTNTEFYNRYATVDNMEFLSDFMSYDKGDVNFIFNDYPRHFEINSDAIIKLLPYDGFYPVNRTLEIATLFSESYSSAAQYTGSEAGQHSQWRALLRPYFAPGIMYNSIKSGLAVDYPIRRATRNNGQFEEQNTTLVDPVNPGYEIGYPLFGGLYGDVTGVVELSGNLPGNTRRNNGNFDWTDPNVNALFWADRLPFESIMAPEDYLTADLTTTTGSLATVMSDINQFLHLNVTASFVPGQVESNNLYKKAVSNFLANVPQFFLKTKDNKFGSSGKLTKFVSQFGSPSKGSQEITAAARTVNVEETKAYMMEIGLMKTDQFNAYSNPAAFGPATSTGYIFRPQCILQDSGTIGDPLNWPKHRGEFAPFAPPYYYGPSLVRITFMPTGDKKEYTLDEILNNDRGEVFVDYLNESSSYYDITSGSYVDSYGNTVASNNTPDYKWNRAWLNRMDIDASINIDNEFPTSAGTSYRSSDPNKWTIMPKWESPLLDFPNRVISDTSYDFSSSVAPTEFTSSTQGLWHQYGCSPSEGQGVYMYIKDVPTGKDEEYDRVAIDVYPLPTTGFDGSGFYNVRKVPKFVIDSGREVSSLADLCGFDPDEIIRKGFDPKKAKRLGELAEDNENSISEAILALPFYLDENGDSKLITLQASPEELGPKIKEFRKNFTKYSLPPVLSQKLLGLVPRGYPIVSETINPFGGDEYDEILAGEDIKQIPVVYLMEHKATLTRQDLADIWQGIMPDLSRQMSFSFSAIDHYMPGDNVEEDLTQFPEVLKEQISLGAIRDGHPRYDLLDIAEKACKQGFFPEIKWLVFKVKERGISTYAEMIIQEVDGPNALGYDNAKEFMTLQGLPESQVERILGDRDEFAKNSYISKHSLNSPTYNWPYDYCSLIESVKINSKVGFRPDLKKEYDEFEAAATQATKDEKAGNK